MCPGATALTRMRVRRELHRERAGEAFERRLGHAVGRESRVADAPRDRRGEHDGAARALLDHAARAGLRQEERAAQIDAEQPIEGGAIGVEEGAPQRDAGIGGDQGDLAEALDGALDQAVHDLDAGDVARGRLAPAAAGADLLGGALCHGRRRRR